MWAKKSKTSTTRTPVKTDVIVGRLDAIDKKLDRIEKLLMNHQTVNVSWFESLSKHVAVLYGKAVLARLNFIELSKGEDISLTTNEQKEILNFTSDKPNMNMLTFNKLIRKNKRTKH